MRNPDASARLAAAANHDLSTPQLLLLDVAAFLVVMAAVGLKVLACLCCRKGKGRRKDLLEEDMKLKKEE